MPAVRGVLSDVSPSPLCKKIYLPLFTEILAYMMCFNPTLVPVIVSEYGNIILRRGKSIVIATEEFTTKIATMLALAERGKGLIHEGSVVLVPKDVLYFLLDPAKVLEISEIVLRLKTHIYEHSGRREFWVFSDRKDKVREYQYILFKDIKDLYRYLPSLSVEPLVL